MKNIPLSDIGEISLISKICSQLMTPQNDTVIGPGDDCAVVRVFPDSDYDLVLKSDPVICGVHFLRSDAPALVGKKAINRVVSDMAAMGASPRWFLTNLVCPTDSNAEVICQMYKGMQECATMYGGTIVGGDTSSGNTLELHVFGCGVLPKNSARLRSSAQPNDNVYVTGTLGCSYESGHHLKFEPRLNEGIWLRNYANAMIDISDGLSSDLWHIADESNASIIIDRQKIPISEYALTTKAPVTHALNDGEDFELLFTIPSAIDESFYTNWKSVFPNTKCTRIGHVENVQSPSVKFSDGEKILRRGFEHFSGNTTKGCSL